MKKFKDYINESKKEKIKLNKKYQLDLGSYAPTTVKTVSFEDDGVNCHYWGDEFNIIGYEIWKMNGYEK